MFEVDWSLVVEEVVRYGLFVGAIFQLVCIGAAIFLPSKSDASDSGDQQRFSLAADVDSETEIEYPSSSSFAGDKTSGPASVAAANSGGGRPVTRSRRQQHQQPEEPKSGGSGAKQTAAKTGRGESRKKRR